jgi:hypothetical protein
MLSLSHVAIAYGIVRRRNCAQIEYAAMTFNVFLAFFDFVDPITYVLSIPRVQFNCRPWPPYLSVT